MASFTPPPPTPTDPYPGYYLLPSGAWAAHDQAYYATFVKKWQKEYDAQVRALEKGEVEREAEEAAEVNMQTEMEKARKEIKEREDRKALTGVKTGEPEKPRMNVQVCMLFLMFPLRDRPVLTILLSTGRKTRLDSPLTTSIDNTPHRCLPQPGGTGGEDRTSAQEQERGRKQIWCVLFTCCSPCITRLINPAGF